MTGGTRAEYSVAISAAPNHDTYVEHLAVALEEFLEAEEIFTKPREEAWVAGGGADRKLAEIYGAAAEVVVVLLTDDYGADQWTAIERDILVARMMTGLAAGPANDVLPIQIGDVVSAPLGPNTVSVDARTVNADELAGVVVQRLALCRSNQSSSIALWPGLPDLEPWPIANFDDLQLQVRGLLTQASDDRILFVQGPAETGKTTASNMILGVCARLPGVRVGRFTCKGTTDLESELVEFASSLDVAVEFHGSLRQNLNMLFLALRKLSEPTVLIFDHFEAGGDVPAWLDDFLLTQVVRSHWLRCIILGQEVPDAVGTPWAGIVSPVYRSELPEPAEWHRFALSQDPRKQVTLETVTAIHQLSGGKATHLAALLTGQR